MTKAITLMILWISILSNPLFPQNTNKSTDPPSNLSYTIENDNDVHLSWDQPSGGGTDTYLHWDSGDNVDGFGFFMGPEHFAVAAKWNPAHLTSYDTWTITKLRFFVVHASPTLKVKVWTGSNATEIYSQDISSFNVGDWTEITLDTPVTIDASTDLWAGLDIDMPLGAGVMGTDAGPGIIGNGDMLRYQGNWYNGDEVGYSHNWNLQIYVQESKKSTEALLGYNVYRDNAMINTDPVPVVTYIDENLYNGSYEYYITAQYDDGESVPSNTVQVLIDNDPISDSDSLALVDLYNQCGGTSWSNASLWLEGPLTDWAGVTVTGDRVTNLQLSNQGVTGGLPESFGDLDALQSLHATDNGITALPESFGNLTVLHTLWLGWNPLQSIPESFGDCQNLDELHLGFTNLGTLPESFGNLSNLTWLALGDAGLNSLPSTFGNLVSVQSCFLWGNNLTELPAGFGNLESVFYLTIDQNQLTSLPESMGDLDNLSHLNLEENQLTSLPESFGDMATLDSLYLAQNQLTSLPESFGDLADLSFVRLSMNNLTAFPASMSNLATIQVIQADQNQIESLPANIGDLGNTLHLLGLSTNNITELPSSIGDLDALYELYITNNQINSLPDEIGDMAVLEVLALDDNNLFTVPESLTDISSLGYLGMMNNNLTSLPESFGDLTADTLLMTGNQLKGLPSSLFDNSFNYLWVDGNILQFGSLEPFVGQVANGFLYENQGKFSVDTLVDAIQNDEFNYSIEVSGENNIYQWYKDGVELDGQNTNILSITAMSSDDLGVYVLKVNNTLITDLELTSKNVEINLITGFEEMSFQEFSISPNPNNGQNIQIILDSDIHSAELEIINMAGQVIKKQTIVNPVTVFDLTSYEKGLYIAKVIYQDGSVQVQKMTIQ